MKEPLVPVDSAILITTVPEKDLSLVNEPLAFESEYFTKGIIRPEF